MLKSGFTMSDIKGTMKVAMKQLYETNSNFKVCLDEFC